jgi:amino acid transporter
MSEPTISGSALTDRGSYNQELARSLSLRENIFITLSSVTPASSVFIIVPSIVVAIGGASVSAMLVAGIAAVFVAMCYAELASSYPITGGEYTWAARTLGKPIGFGLFLLTLVTGVFIIAVIALGTGDYLGVAVPALTGKGAGIAVIIGTAVIAALNIRTNAWVTGVFLALELLALVVLTVAGLVHVQRGPGIFFTPQGVGQGGALAPVAWSAVVALVSVALFAYNGYGAAVYYAEETRGATRTIGRAILISLVATVACEVIPLAAVVLGTPSLQGLMSAEQPMSYFLTATMGSGMNTAVSLGIAIAIINAVIAITIQIARLLYSSARDRSWPSGMDRVLGAVHPRLQTPVAATVVVGIAAALCGWLVPFDWLLLATGASVVVLYLAVALSALALRRNRSHQAPAGGYRMPLYPLPPLIVVAFMIYVAYQGVVSDVRPLAVAVVCLILGIGYYYAFIHPRRGDRWVLPDPIHDED